VGIIYLAFSLYSMVSTFAVIVLCVIVHRQQNILNQYSANETLVLPNDVEYMANPDGGLE
jgi:hypothetical protein